LIGKIFGLIKNEIQIVKASLQFHPDFFISHGSTIAGFAAFILHKPHIALEDTFNMEQVRISVPFSSVVLTGDYHHPSLGKKEIRYPGFHELAYLHPNVFKPNENVLEKLGVAKRKKYAIIRFVAWNATHDVGQQGIANSDKLKLVKLIARYMKVFVSSEGVLPDAFREYQIRIKPEQMHDALHYAHLFVGEGATMASEAALLGTPSVFIHNKSFGSIEDQASYGLIFRYDNDSDGVEAALQKISELASEDKVKDRFARLRDQMLTKKIDLTAFLFWFVTNYPQSVSTMKSDPGYILKFR